MPSSSHRTIPAPRRAVIFDLDDTLYPEADYVRSGFRAVAAWAAETLRIPAEPAIAELDRLFADGVRRDTFDRWLRARGFGHQAAELVPQMVEAYRNHSPTLTPFDGIPELLQSLSDSCALGLVSDGYLTVQEKKWRALGVQEYFGAVVFSDALGRDAWKPSPRPFERVLEQLGCAPTAALYVGDNPAKDFLGAGRLGMHTIRCRFPGGEHRQVEPLSDAHAPTWTVESLSQLLPCIRRWLVS